MVGFGTTAVEPTAHTHPPHTNPDSWSLPWDQFTAGIVPAPVSCKVRTHQSRKIFLVLLQEQQHWNPEGCTEPGKMRLSKGTPGGVLIKYALVWPWYNPTHGCCHCP